MSENYERQFAEVYIGNLPSDITEDDLRNNIIFENFEIIRLLNHGIKAFAFGDCGTFENACKFCEIMDGRDLNGRKMRVKVSRKSTNTARGEESFNTNKTQNTNLSNKPRIKSEKSISPRTKIQTTEKGATKKSDLQYNNSDDRPPPLRPATTEDHIRNSSKGVHTQPYSCAAQHSVPENSNFQAHSPTNCYGAAALPNTYYQPHTAAKEQSHKFHNIDGITKDSKPISGQHVKNALTSRNTEYPKGYNETDYNVGRYENTSYYSKGPKDYKRNEVASGYPKNYYKDRQTFIKCQEYDQHNSHFSKSSPRSFKQSENKTYLDQNFVKHPSQYPKQSYENSSYHQKFEKGKPRYQNFQNNCYNQFNKYSRSQYESNTEGYKSRSSEDDIVARIHDLRLQQTNIHKSLNNRRSMINNERQYHKSNELEISQYDSTPEYQNQEYNDDNVEEEEDYEFSVLSVANFPFRTTEEMIFELFEDFQPIEVRMLCNYPADITTEAFVILPNEELASNAIMELDNTQYRKRTIIVSDVNDDDILEELLRII